jgi:hypothetical protein
MPSTFDEVHPPTPSTERVLPLECQAVVAVLAILAVYGLGIGAMGLLVGTFAGPHLLLAAAILLIGGILAWMSAARVQHGHPSARRLSITTFLWQGGFAGACVVGSILTGGETSAVALHGLMFCLCVSGIGLVCLPSRRGVS